MSGGFINWYPLLRTSLANIAFISLYLQMQVTDTRQIQTETYLTPEIYPTKQMPQQTKFLCKFSSILSQDQRYPWSIKLVELPFKVVQTFKYQRANMGTMYIMN